METQQNDFTIISLLVSELKHSSFLQHIKWEHPTADRHHYLLKSQTWFVNQNLIPTQTLPAKFLNSYGFLLFHWRQQSDSGVIKTRIHTYGPNSAFSYEICQHELGTCILGWNLAIISCREYASSLIQGSKKFLYNSSKGNKTCHKHSLIIENWSIKTSINKCRSCHSPITSTKLYVPPKNYIAHRDHRLQSAAPKRAQTTLLKGFKVLKAVNNQINVKLKQQIHLNNCFKKAVLSMWEPWHNRPQQLWTYLAW